MEDCCRTGIIWIRCLSIFLLCSVSAAFQPQSSCPAALVSHGLFERTSLITPLQQQQSTSEDCTEESQIGEEADDDRRRHILLSILAGATTGELNSRLQRNKRGVHAAETAPQIDYFSDIIRPPLDKSDYVTYTLPNGLRVLLCSDPTSNEAAAAMDVHVGACSDPPGVAGLAHFTEHMLFLGTKKYPKEDSFESFLSSHGGTSNAFTDSENTVYFFSLNAADNVVEDALLRFGSFFSCPLFSESATGRELNAIESEHAKNLQSDIFRNFQINKARANQDHPFAKFFTGNKRTLLDDTKAAGIDLRNELIQFYNRYYSANQMTLAIVSPQPLEALQRVVTDAFGDIPARSVAAPEQSWAGILPFTTSNTLIPSFEHVVQIVPVSDLRQIQLSWPIIYKSDQERALSTLIKPAEYVAHLLGHEGPRSLLSVLKQKGWANSLGCAVSDELSDFEVFDVSVGLTTQGLLMVDAVVATLYSYLQMAQQRMIPDYVLKEVLQLEELDWRFLTTGRAGGYVTSLSTAMQKYPPALYVAGPRRLALDEYTVDPQLSGLPRSSFPSKQQLDRTRDNVQRYLQALTVENSLVTVLSKSFEGQTNQNEKWYGTKYNVSRIAPSALASWKNPESSRKLQIDFPKPNMFIPTEAGLRVKFPPNEKRRAKSFEERMAPIEAPRIIRDDGPSGPWTVYFKEDKTYGKPLGFIVFQVLTKEVYASSTNAALANLYEISAVDRLNEYAYDANLAGLTYEVKVLPRGVRLTFGGYSDKLKKFASFISRKLSVDVNDLLPKDDKDFDRYKDQIMRGLSAFDVKQPYAHASYYAQLSLQPRRFQYTNRELRDATRRTTLPDLISYVNSLWTSGKGVALIQGNYEEKDALELVKSVGDVLPFRPIASSDYPPRIEALPLPHSKPFTVPPRLLVAEPNPSNENCVSYIMLQSLEKTEKDHVLMEILNAIVEEPFYNDMRTKKQLGYIVASGVKGLAETRTISFIVQSNVAPSDSLTIEILSFLDTVEKKLLTKLNNGDIAVYAKSLIDKKTEPDKELAMEVTRNWSEISTGRFQFDRLQREAAMLLDIEKDDLMDFWRRLYSSEERRVLITEIIPREGAASASAPPLTTGYGRNDSPSDNLVLGIDDIGEFRRIREKLVYEPGELDFPNYSWSSTAKNNNAAATVVSKEDIATASL